MLEQNALFLDKKKFNNGKVAEMIEYLQRTDPAFVYLDREEFSAFQSSLKGNYVGIGMEIEKEESGNIVCFPYPGSPAQLKGIESGDTLESINGRNVLMLSIYSVSSKLLGAEGTKVDVTIVKRDGSRKNIELVRKFIKTTSVEVELIGNIDVIKIYSFGASTKRDLQSALCELTDSSVIVIDLRDNRGGDLYKSIDSAMLFLEKGAKIISIRTRHGIRRYESTTPAFNSKSKVFIWQNENTASAAEVFIAALTKNRRAESIGKRSYGKGISQDIFELSDGSALIFSSGLIQTPDGKIYHQKGLAPNHVLNNTALTTKVYFRKVRELLEVNGNMETSN